MKTSSIKIPTGSGYLFRSPRAGSPHGPLLAWSQRTTDPDHEGRSTPKGRASESAADPEAGWPHLRVTAKPLDPCHKPITLTVDTVDAVRLVAKLVQIVEHPPDESPVGA